MKVVPVDPELRKLLDEAIALFVERRLDAALSRFSNIVLSVDPGCAEAWYGRGWAFLEKGAPARPSRISIGRFSSPIRASHNSLKYTVNADGRTR